ncbi:MAG: hypothetical protein K1W16_13925 [Lachnospiraceae bacterium]
MQEILAKNLKPLFDNTPLTGTKTYSGELYEVWKVSDEVFEFMCNMNDEEFEKLCPEGMWRSSTGSNMGFPTECFTVNKRKLKCWDRREELYGKKYRRTKYKSLLEYLCENIGASQPKNVCALAVDLAKHNNMIMGELFTKYEG